MTELERCEFAKKKGFTYDPITGELKGVRRKTIISQKVGYINCGIYYKGKNYSLLGHRLAWYLHYGELPKNHIDHIDGDRTNNKIDNLRDVTKHQNSFNLTKAKGYYWNKQRKKFQSYIKLNDKHIHIGLFSTESDARNAYLEAKKKYHVIQ